MADTTVRWSVVKALLAALRNAPRMGNVLVEPGHPGERVQPETVWVNALDGDVDIPVMTAGRKERDDVFTIPIQVQVLNNSTLDETMTRAQQIVAAVEDVLAGDPSLQGLDGVIDAQITHRSDIVVDTHEGARAGAEIVVTVHSRLL